MVRLPSLPNSKRSVTRNSTSYRSFYYPTKPKCCHLPRRRSLQEPDHSKYQPRWAAIPPTHLVASGHRSLRQMNGTSRTVQKGQGTATRSLKCNCSLWFSNHSTHSFIHPFKDHVWRMIFQEQEKVSHSHHLGTPHVNRRKQRTELPDHTKEPCVQNNKELPKHSGCYPENYPQKISLDD